MHKRTNGEKVYTVFSTIFLIIITLTCVCPLVNIIALSFSNAQAAAGQSIVLWPKGFSLESYNYIIGKIELWRAFFVSVKRIIIGVPLNMALIILVAYPLSKSNQHFPGRVVFVWMFMISMLFNGGLIPTFMTVSMTGITDTIWALILPGAVPVYFVVLMLNFFRTIPIEIEEAALIDGASHWRILAQIYIPTSMPGIATIALLAGVGHWNSWFDGIIYMNKVKNYPLQSYLQTIMIDADMLADIKDPKALQALFAMSSRTLQSAQILVALIPIIVVYPFVQRSFIKGIVVGSVKG